MKTKEGDTYDPAEIGEDLKSIYKTGYFSDVMVDTKDTDKGKAITFIVVETALGQRHLRIREQEGQNRRHTG